MKITLAIAAASFLLAAPALAQPPQAEMDLTWNDCILGPYAVDMSNDCTTNSGFAGSLFVSFSPPTTLPLYEACLAIINLQTSGAALSDWWHLEVGGCRGDRIGQGPGSLSISADFTAGPTSCADFWIGR